MSSKKNRRKPVATQSPFEEARDELFQHIMRCGVIGSAEEHQAEWFNETMAYMTDRYRELDETQVSELRTLGERFAKPAKAQSNEQPEDAASAA